MPAATAAEGMTFGCCGSSLAGRESSCASRARTFAAASRSASTRASRKSKPPKPLVAAGHIGTNRHTSGTIVAPMRHRKSRSVGHGALVRPPEGAARSASQSAIPDVLGRHLRVLFCGINPGRVSAAAGAHFANPRNDFWRLLHEAGFTRRLLTPSEQWLALDDGVGVTNAAQRTTPGSSDLRSADFVGSAERLEQLAVTSSRCGSPSSARRRTAVRSRNAGSSGPRTQARPAHATLRAAFDLAGERGGPVRGAAPLVRGARTGEPARRSPSCARDPARPPRPCLPSPVRPPGRPGCLDRSRRRARALTSRPTERFAASSQKSSGSPTSSSGPWVWTRRHVWFWPAQGHIYDTREQFAVVRVADVRAVRPTSHDSLLAGPDAREEHRWWTVDEIERSKDEFAPRSLATRLRELITNGPPDRPVDVGR